MVADIEVLRKIICLGKTVTDTYEQYDIMPQKYNC